MIDFYWSVNFIFKDHELYSIWGISMTGILESEGYMSDLLPAESTAAADSKLHRKNIRTLQDSYMQVRISVFP